MWSRFSFGLEVFLGGSALGLCASYSPVQGMLMPNVLKVGATERVRTVDLYLGKVPLYQLSYSRI